MPDINLETVILASGELPADFPVRNRKELTYHGVDFVEIAREAMSAVGKTTVVGVDIPGGNTFLESFRLGLEATRADYVLMGSADMPFLKCEHVQRLLDVCDFSAGLNYGVVPLERCQAQFPDLKRTTVKLREGEITGGNLFLMDRQALLAALPKIEEMYLARKNPLKVAGKIGFGLLFALALSKIHPYLSPIAKLERSASKAAGFKIRAAISNDPEIATDIDNSGQYAWLKTLEKSQNSADL